MRYILHYIEKNNNEDGVLIHIEYNFNNNNEPFVEDLRLYNIIAGEVGQLVNLPAVDKMSIAVQLLPLMTK